MNIFELQENKCIKSEELEIKKTDQKHTIRKSQECIFVWDIEKQVIRIRCSYTKMITKLAKNKEFKLTKVLISTNMRARDKVLRITGELSFKGFTIRKNYTNLSKERWENMVKDNPFHGGKK